MFGTPFRVWGARVVIPRCSHGGAAVAHSPWRNAMSCPQRACNAGDVAPAPAWWCPQRRHGRGIPSCWHRLGAVQVLRPVGLYKGARQHLSPRHAQHAHAVAPADRGGRSRQRRDALSVRWASGASFHTPQPTPRPSFPSHDPLPLPLPLQATAPLVAASSRCPCPSCMSAQCDLRLLSPPNHPTHSLSPPNLHPHNQHLATHLLWMQARHRGRRRRSPLPQTTRSADLRNKRAMGNRT